jgi:ParB family chromosome partitioning protein
MNFHYPDQKKVIQVKLEDIQMEPGPYCMSFDFDIEKLKNSIHTVGLLNPPLLVPGRAGLMEIVTGYRRLTACKALKWREIPCLDISSACLSALELLLLNFHDNLATRELNPIEKGMFLKRASCLLSKDKIIQDYMPLLGLPCHDSALQIFLGMDELSEDQRRVIADKKVSLQTMTALMEMDIASRSSIFNWIIELNLNFNQQLQFIEFVNDIAIQFNDFSTRFLKEADLFNTLKDTKMNKPQKAKAILEKLRLMRYPRLVNVEKEFQQQLHKLNLPKFARILHSPGFEDVHCHLTVDFQNGPELKQRMLAVSQIEGLEKLSVF